MAYSLPIRNRIDAFITAAGVVFFMFGVWMVAVLLQEQRGPMATPEQWTVGTVLLLVAFSSPAFLGLALVALVRRMKLLALVALSGCAASVIAAIVMFVGLW